MAIGGLFHRRPPALLVVIAVLLCGAAFILAGPVVAQKSKKASSTPDSQNSLKTVLTQYQGQTTNLGMLVKVSGDFFVVAEEGATVYYPLSSIQSFRVLKPGEDVSIPLEIRLVSKD